MRWALLCPKYTRRLTPRRSTTKLMMITLFFNSFSYGSNLYHLNQKIHKAKFLGRMLLIIYSKTNILKDHMGRVIFA